MNNKPKSSNRHGIAPEENKKKRKSKKKLSYCKDYGIILLEYNITEGRRSYLLEPRHAS